MYDKIADTLRTVPVIAGMVLNPSVANGLELVVDTHETISQEEPAGSRDQQARYWFHQVKYDEFERDGWEHIQNAERFKEDENGGLAFRSKQEIIEPFRSQGYEYMVYVIGFKDGKPVMEMIDVSDLGNVGENAQDGFLFGEDLKVLLDYSIIVLMFYD